jgi:hypothetical protein
VRVLVARLGFITRNGKINYYNENETELIIQARHLIDDIKVNRKEGEVLKSKQKLELKLNECAEDCLQWFFGNGPYLPIPPARNRLLELLGSITMVQNSILFIIFSIS